MNKISEIKEKLNKINLRSNQETDKEIFNKEIVELNTKLNNTIYSSVQLLSDRLTVDWDRILKYCSDDLKYIQDLSSKINEIGKNYYQLISNFEDLKSNANDLPDINVEYCKTYLE